MKRFLRDAGILLAFCGAFYFLTVLVGRLDGDSDNDRTDFSRARKRADVHYKRKDWNSAAIEFRTLTEQDPFDGHAWYNYASCFFYMRRGASARLNELTAETNPDPDAIEAETARVRFASDQAHAALLKVVQFARYRATAQLRLAVIETSRDNYDEAMDYLEEYIEDGNFTQHGLSIYDEFGAGGPEMVSPGNQPRDEIRLHGESRFWDLEQKEINNRSSL